jgi:hypothetical protein
MVIQGIGLVRLPAERCSRYRELVAARVSEKLVGKADVM